MSKYTGKMPEVYVRIDNGQKIGEMANKLAYPGNPKIAQYPSGKPTPAYKAALKEQWKGKKYYWSKASKAGASCDEFAGTSVKAGYDHNMDVPRPGLWILEDYFLHSSKYFLVGINTTRSIKVKSKDLQDGDIILYQKVKKKKLKKQGHICIYYKGKIKEASARHYYGRTTDKVSARLDPKGKKYVYIFRAKDTLLYKSIKLNDTGVNVTRLQRFLNWYYADKINAKKMKRLTLDGKFGPVTKARLIKFQEDNKLKPDGVCGKATLSKMKSVNVA